MIKAIAIVGQLSGFTSSVLVALGYAPVKGTAAWAKGDGSEFRKHQTSKRGWCLSATWFLRSAS
jgi:hypothetical protein